MSKGKKALNYNPDFTGKKNNFSNKLECINGRFISPKFYVCRDCGVKLTLVKNDKTANHIYGSECGGSNVL